jgi:hypothetical protein
MEEQTDSLPREVRMALIRWEPAVELNTIQNEMNRMFNTFFDQPTRLFHKPLLSDGFKRLWAWPRTSSHVIAISSF